MEEILNNIIIPSILPTITAIVGWLLGRGKEKVEVQGSELDNVKEGLEIYREMISDLKLSLKEAISQNNNLAQKLSKSIEELNEAKRIIKELEENVKDLTCELKKYKQLNVKTK